MKALQPQLDNPKFTASEIVTKSVAAAGICDWVVNIVGYYKIHCEVEPKRIALAGANVQLREANDTMDRINAKLAALEAKVAELRAQFEEANEEKLRVEREAEQTSQQLNLAQRLVRALSSEKVRWAESVGSLKRDMDLLVGDVLLSAAFLSYIGPFSLRLRRVCLLYLFHIVSPSFFFLFFLHSFSNVKYFFFFFVRFFLNLYSFFWYYLNDVYVEIGQRAMVARVGGSEYQSFRERS